MTNAERQTHVIRILGTNKAGEILPDIWADVERIDRMEIRTQVIQVGGVVQYQTIKLKLRWLDDPDGPNYDEKGDKNREHKIVKVCDPSLPQDKLDDPDEWIPIRSIVRMEIKFGGGNIIKHFKENNPNIDYDGRVVENRRITHWDTTIDEAAQAAFDADPTRKVYVERDGNRGYQRIEGTEDEDQYVEHQIVKKLNRQDSQQLLSTGNDQRRVLHLRNQYQIDESHPAKLEELGTGEINPPYRLDPFQNIINVQFQFKVYVIIVAQNGEYAVANPDMKSVKVIETRSNPSVVSLLGKPVTATLIECPVNAGEDFASLETTWTAVGGFPEEISAYVCPKTKEIQENWFDWYVASVNDEDNLSSHPFLLRLGKIPMGVPTTIKFKIRYEPHLLDENADNNKMVQMYPTTGTHDWAGVGLTNHTKGWVWRAYRTDKHGTEKLFKAPPEWKTDSIILFGTSVIAPGLLFGKDPPLIAADIPQTP